MLQQPLPFTVLKLCQIILNISELEVATALTVYAIETHKSKKIYRRICLVATALTVYGIETDISTPISSES